MTVALLGTSADRVAAGFPVTEPFPLPAGENRILLVSVAVSSEQPTTYDPDDFPITYGGVPMTAHRFASVTTGGLISIVAALAVDGQSFANSNIVITNLSGITSAANLRARVFGGADTGDDALTVFAAGTAVNNLILAPVNVDAAGDLIHTFASASADGALVNDDGYTTGGTLDFGNFISRDAYSAVVSGAQAVEWTATPGYSSGNMAAVAVVIQQAPVLPPPCDEIGRASRAYVSAYDRTRVHQVRLYRFEKRCMVANFNGAFPPARKIISATWRTDRPEIGVISNPQISADQRETMVLFASQLWGFANLRAEVLLDNGEVYNQVYLVNVREASWYFNDPPPQVGPFSLTVTV